MFVGKGKGGDKILKEFVWTIIFKIFFPKYLVVRRTTRSQFLVVLTHFLVVENTRILLPWQGRAGQGRVGQGRAGANER